MRASRGPAAAAASPESRTRNTLAVMGQATTEVVLLFPIFMFLLYAFAKVFAMLILVQKMEIASFYAARRWQLESHRNVDFEADDSGALRSDIEQRVSDYIGFNNPSMVDFLDLDTGHGARFDCQRTQVWNVCTLKVNVNVLRNFGWIKSKQYAFEVTKYVPNRDRPIAFVLPGLKE